MSSQSFVLTPFEMDDLEGARALWESTGMWLRQAAREGTGVLLGRSVAARSLSG